jgi:hypothetical protein
LEKIITLALSGLLSAATAKEFACFIILSGFLEASLGYLMVPGGGIEPP